MTEQRIGKGQYFFYKSQIDRSQWERFIKLEINKFISGVN